MTSSGDDLLNQVHEEALSTLREEVVRPGQRTYRARFAPVVELLESDGLCILVTRTHDVDLATAIAGNVLLHAYGDSNVTLPAARQGWFRRVPWDSLGLGVDYTWINANSGDKGATPGVIFYRRDS